jgi:NitT/TauT family transport system permease protein
MRRKLAYLLLSLGVLVAWEYLGSTSSSARLLISSPKLMYSYFIANPGGMLIAAWTTFIEAALGLLLATAFSFVVIIVCFYQPRLMDYLLPVMVASQVIPLIVLAPFFVIALGIGIASKVVMAALLSFFPTFVNFAQGYRLIDDNVHELLHVYDAPTAVRIRKAYLPLALPSIMAGLKVSATLSVIGAIVAEFTGARIGLGKNLFLSAIRLEPELMMVSLVFAALLGAIMYGSIHLIERRLGHWYVT